MKMLPYINQSHISRLPVSRLCEVPPGSSSAFVEAASPVPLRTHLPAPYQPEDTIALCPAVLAVPAHARSHPYYIKYIKCPLRCKLPHRERRSDGSHSQSPRTMLSFHGKTDPEFRETSDLSSDACPKAGCAFRNEIVSRTNCCSFLLADDFPHCIQDSGLS